MKHFRSILKQSTQISFYQAYNIILRFVSIIIYTKYLAPSILGNFTLARTIVNLTGVYSLFGLNHGILRQASLAIGAKKNNVYNEIKNYASTLSIIISLIVSALTFTFAGVIGEEIFGDSNFVIFIRLFALLIPIRNLNFIITVLLKVNKKAATGQFLYLVIYPTIIILAFLVGSLFLQGRNLAILSFIIGNFLYLIFLLIQRNKLKIKASFHLDKNEKRNLFSISFPMFIAAALNRSQGWIDLFVLGILASSSDVGIYFVGLRIASFVQIPAVSFNHIFMPIAGRLIGAGEFAELNNLYKIITRIIFFLGSSIFAIIFFMQDIILLLFSKDYSIAGQVIIFILIGQLINISVGATRQLLTVSGGAKINLYNSILMIVLMLSLSYFLIPEYGMIGAAIANASSLGLLNIISVIELSYFYKLSPFSKQYFLTFVFFILLFLISLILPSISIIKLIVFLTFYILLTIIFTVSKEEKNKARLLIRKKFSF